MYKNCAAQLPLRADLRFGSFGHRCKGGPAHSRKLPAASLSTALLLASLALIPVVPANAAPPPLSLAQCVRQLNSCNSNCDRYPAGQFKTSCYQRCASQHTRCARVDAGTWTGNTGPDPLNPKGTGGRTPPTGGTKSEPKASPKVNDTRPPMGGGVFHPKTSGGGSDGPILHSGGNDGPVLHSGGSPGPILKSNGGSGPNFRSGERH